MNITSPGIYTARNGRQVIISEVNCASPFTFPVKGHVLIPNSRTGRIKREWTIWKLDGQHQAVGQHNWDIVAQA